MNKGPKNPPFIFVGHRNHSYIISPPASASLWVTIHDFIKAKQLLHRQSYVQNGPNLISLIRWVGTVVRPSDRLPKCRRLSSSAKLQCYTAFSNIIVLYCTAYNPNTAADCNG